MSKCIEEACPKILPEGHGKAQRLGWFMQRNGDAWCPDHNPDWVAEWRAMQAQKKIDERNQ